MFLRKARVQANNQTVKHSLQLQPLLWESIFPIHKFDNTTVFNYKEDVIVFTNIVQMQNMYIKYRTLLFVNFLYQTLIKFQDGEKLVSVASPPSPVNQH